MHVRQAYSLPATARAHNLRAASDGKRLNTVRRDFAGKLNGIIGIEIFQSFGVANG